MRNVALAFLILLCACVRVQGEFRAEGGPADWRMQPNRCYSGGHRGFFGADMYRAAEGEDTELVVMSDGGGPSVLARIPGQDTMVVLRPADCARFESDVHYNGTSVNRVRGVSGYVRIDCTRPEIGHVTGSATFSCY